MFASTVVTLGCAFLLLMAAGVVVAITRDANQLKAQRQGERIEATVNARMRQGELKLERLVAADDLPEALLAELTAGNRIVDIRLGSTPPSDPLSRLALRAADGTTAIWLAWSPPRPGDVMLRRFLGALSAVAVLFSAVFAA